jgi:hypothetical protein
MKLAIALLASLAGVASADPVRVAGGTYRAPDGAAEHVAAFRLDREPVTNRDFLAFVTANPAWRRDRVGGLLADTSYLARWVAPDRLGDRARPRAPVVEVSWFAARAYCASRGGRLPTEAEWELAARDTRDDLAWYAQPVPDVLPDVGGARGIGDLHGLVWEWIEDFTASQIDGQACGAGAAETTDPDAYASFLRFAFRGSLEARFTTPSLGFRCAYDDAPKPASVAKPPFALPAPQRGHVVLVSMFYGSCPAACPALIDDIGRVLAEVPDSDARVLLVSFDAARDTPQHLAELAREHHLDARWTLVAAGEDDARALAGALGFRYRKLASGAFWHTTAVVALDREGRPIARMDRLGDHAALAAAIAH